MKTGMYKLRHERRCRMCQRPDSIRALTRHHVVPQRLGKRNCNENIVPLCRPCHDLIDNVAFRHSLAARSMLRKVMLPSEVSHARRVMGTADFERMYPTVVRPQPVVVKMTTASQRRRARRQRARAAELAAHHAAHRRGLHHKHCEPGLCVVSCPVWLAANDHLVIAAR